MKKQIYNLRALTLEQWESMTRREQMKFVDPLVKLMKEQMETKQNK